MKITKVIIICVLASLGSSVAARTQSDATPTQAAAPTDQTTTPKKKTVTHKHGVSAKTSTATHQHGVSTKRSVATHKHGVSTKTSAAAHQHAVGIASKTVTTPSGLKYTDLAVGKGPTPKDGDMVVVDYTGHFPDGKIFDTSIGRGPFNFVLGRGNVIKGWDEGVASMHVGGKRKLIIPPALAYGAQGTGGVIPPNATLEFEVTLLKIQ